MSLQTGQSDTYNNVNATMQNYHNECSWGKVGCNSACQCSLRQVTGLRAICRLQARFDSKSNVVLDLTGVNIPCFGTWQGQPYNSSK